MSRMVSRSRRNKVPVDGLIEGAQGIAALIHLTHSEFEGEKVGDFHDDGLLGGGNGGSNQRFLIIPISAADLMYIG